MHSLNHQYYAALLEEQRLKQWIFNLQIQLELMGVNDADEERRQGYIKLLAIRIVEINQQMEEWLNTIELDLDEIAK